MSRSVERARTTRRPTCMRTRKVQGNKGTNGSSMVAEKHAPRTKHAHKISYTNTLERRMGRCPSLHEWMCFFLSCFLVSSYVCLRSKVGCACRLFWVCATNGGACSHPSQQRRVSALKLCFLCVGVIVYASESCLRDCPCLLIASRRIATWSSPIVGPSC